MSKILLSLTLIFLYGTLLGQRQFQNTIGHIQDEQGNSYPIVKLKDGKWWLGANLQISTLKATCYQNQKNNCSEYGYLYTFEAAQKSCSTFGRGWHLPSQQEWLDMLRKYGALRVTDSDVLGRRPYQELIKGGKSPFNVLLAGRQTFTKTFSQLGTAGFYWSSTEAGNRQAWHFNFLGREKWMTLSRSMKTHSLSVRCVKTR